MRKEHELAECIKWGWVYHHTGIPTTEKKEGEVYIPLLKFYVSGFPTSPFGIEWMRFEEDCQMHPLIQKVPHIAFEVQDIENLKSASNLNGNLNCSKELEHYAS